MIYEDMKETMPQTAEHWYVIRRHEYLEDLDEAIQCVWDDAPTATFTAAEAMGLLFAEEIVWAKECTYPRLDLWDEIVRAAGVECDSCGDYPDPPKEVREAQRRLDSIVGKGMSWYGKSSTRPPMAYLVELLLDCVRRNNL